MKNIKRQADITQKDSIFWLTGDLCFSSVMAVNQKALALFAKENKMTVDFSELHTSDSTGLALMVEWIKYALHHHKKLLLRNLPPHLLLIAKAAGMTEILDIGDR